MIPGGTLTVPFLEAPSLYHSWRHPHCTYTSLHSHSLAGVSEFRAHYVDSYLEPQLMVVCDGPTEDSTAKFWQMVWDERCTYLIMLTPQDGDVREHRLCDITSLLVHSLPPSLPPSSLTSQYHCYWPNFGSLRQYGNLIVEVEEESAEHVYTTRKLLLTDSKVAVNILFSPDTLCSRQTQ